MPVLTGHISPVHILRLNVLRKNPDPQAEQMEQQSKPGKRIKVMGINPKGF